MARIFTVGQNNKWNKKLVEQEKQLIRQELLSVEDPKNPDQKLDYVLKKVTSDELMDSSHGRMKKLIFIISALVQHSKFGGLSKHQIQKLTDFAYAILQSEGIQPGKSRLAFLYGEIHLALSLIYRKTGEHWFSAWQHQLSCHVAGNDVPGGQGFQLISLGIRSMRLCQSGRAIQYFTRAIESNLSASELARAHLGLIRALRLSGLVAESSSVAAEALKLPHLTETERHELQWEETCRRAQLTHDLTQMVRMVKNGNSHYKAVYILEASLWAKAVSERRFEKKLPKIRYIARNKALKPQQAGILFDAAVLIEKVYDFEIPISIRLRNVGELLLRVREFVTLESEMLFWAACGRWLARAHLFPMATQTLSEYQQLSERVSRGKNQDTLNLVTDLFEKSWYLKDEVLDNIRNLTIADAS